jgi:glucosamine-6-phosphate deaminase
MTIHPPVLHIIDSAEAVSRAAAAAIADQIRSNGDSVLLLPTGQTMLAVYADFVTLVHSEQLNLRHVRTFNLDEFYGLPPGHPGSYHRYMQQYLFDHVPIAAANIDLINSAAADIASECARYEANINAVGGIDLAVLGIGVNGHIGFNEPGSDFASRTRLVSLREESRVANASRFNGAIAQVPRQAVTVGIATIMEARHILLIATGASKAQAIHAMLHGPVTTTLPASALRRHGHVTVLIDQAAASLL